VWRDEGMGGPSYGFESVVSGVVTSLVVGAFIGVGDHGCLVVMCWWLGWDISHFLFKGGL